jgi:hypothetical protein
MTIEPFTYADFEAARERLVREIHTHLTANDRAFLLSFKNGEPEWGLFPLEALQRMPAVQWKLSNIRKLKKQNPRKHGQQLQALNERLAVKF